MKYCIDNVGMIRRRKGFKVQMWSNSGWKETLFDWQDLVIFWLALRSMGWQKLTPLEAMKRCGDQYSKETYFIDEFEKELL